MSRLEVNPRDVSTLAFTSDYYAMLGQNAQAQQHMARALEIAPADSDVLFRAAILYNHFGDTERTINFLSKSVSAGYSRTVIRDTPDFDHLKDNPRFRALIAEPEALLWDHVNSRIFAGLDADLNKVIGIYTVFVADPVSVFAREISLHWLTLSGRDPVYGCARGVERCFLIDKLDGIVVRVAGINYPS